MAYKITRDYLKKLRPEDSTFSLVGKGKYRKRNEDGIIIKSLTSAEMPHKFRCLDDEGNIYFGGVSNNDSSFAPMDDYGADYGVTSIEYKNTTTGIWEQL